MIQGQIVSLAGPTAVARGMAGVRMHDRVSVGHAGLLGEVIRLSGGLATIQVYEDTLGLRPGEPVVGAGEPLLAELGPGLLGNVLDGVQRPLEALSRAGGSFIARGVTAPALSRERVWEFEPRARAGEVLEPGDVLGIVNETPAIVHRILVPPDRSGRLVDIRAGTFSVDQPLAWLEDGTALSMMQRWPVRRPRPCKRRLPPAVPFLTGQRVLDMLYPIPAGGTAVVPGGFGTGKTVVEHSLARHSDAQVIVYVGCGERGNEISEVLAEFPHLTDPVTGRPLMERTVVIVNTSNMPVAAREASIYTGITVAEYYRDQGYRVALMADSTSRWAEALREISSRLEEMPGEEGYPTYMATRLAQFYERAGLVACLGSEEYLGSVTIVSAISPAGGDLSEPVTQASLRVAGALWALDARLAHRRHFPALDWNTSFSHYHADLDPWFCGHVTPDWPQLRGQVMALLQQEEALQEVVQLVGIDSIAEEERVVLEAARLLREEFLRQSAYSSVDASCSPGKLCWMARGILAYRQRGIALLRQGVTLEAVLAHPARERLARLKDQPCEGLEENVKSILESLA